MSSISVNASLTASKDALNCSLNHRRIVRQKSNVLTNTSLQVTKVNDVPEPRLELNKDVRMRPSLACQNAAKAAVTHHCC